MVNVTKKIRNSFYSMFLSVPFVSSFVVRADEQESSSTSIKDLLVNVSSQLKDDGSAGKLTDSIDLIVKIIDGVSTVYEKMLLKSSASAEFGLEFLSNINSKVYFGDDFFGFSAETNYLINGFINAFFWIPRFFFFIFAKIGLLIEKGTNGVSDFINYALDFSGELFLALFGAGSALQLSALVIGIVVLRAVIAMARSGSFLKEIIRGIVPILMMILLFTKTSSGSYLVKNAYDSINTMGTEVSATFIDTFDNSNISSEKISEDGLYDYYFRETIWKTFKNMNDYPNIVSVQDQAGNKLTRESGFKNLGEKEFLKLVFYNNGVNPDLKLNDDTTVKDLAKKSLRLSGDYGMKSVFVFASIFDTFTLGLICVSISIFQFVTGLFFILLLILGVFSGLVTMLFPSNGALFEWIKKAFVVTLLSAFVQGIGVFILWIYGLVGKILLQAGISNYVVVSILKPIIIFVVYKYRHHLVGVVMGNQLRMKTNSRIKGFGSSKKTLGNGTGQVEKGVKGRLANARRSVSKHIPKSVKSTAKFGALASVVGAGYLSSKVKSSKAGEFVGNKLRNSKTLDRFANFRDNVQGGFHAVGNAKDRLFANLYNSRAKMFERTGNLEKQAEMQEKADKYSTSIEERLSKRKNRFEARRDRRINYNNEMLRKLREKFDLEQTKQRLLKRRQDRKEGKIPTSGYRDFQRTLPKRVHQTQTKERLLAQRKARQEGTESTSGYMNFQRKLKEKRNNSSIVISGRVGKPRIDWESRVKL